MRDRWKTIERPHNMTDLSTVFQWALNDLQGLPWFLSVIYQWTLWSAWSPSNFELVQTSLSVVFEGSGLSVNAQRSLNERSVVSPSFNDLSAICRQTQQVLVNSLGYSVNYVGRSWSFRDLSWSLRDHYDQDHYLPGITTHQIHWRPCTTSNTDYFQGSYPPLTLGPLPTRITSHQIHLTPEPLPTWISIRIRTPRTNLPPELLYPSQPLNTRTTAHQDHYPPVAAAQKRC